MNDLIRSLLIKKIKTYYNLTTKSAIFKTFKYLVALTVVPSDNLDSVIQVSLDSLGLENVSEHLRLFVFLLMVESAQQMYEWVVSSNYSVVNHVVEYLQLALPSLKLGEAFKEKLYAIENKILAGFPTWLKYIDPFIQQNYKEMRLAILKELSKPNPSLKVAYKYSFEFSNIVDIRFSAVANLHALELTFCGFWLLSSQDSSSIICLAGAVHTRALNSIIHYLPHDSPEMVASVCSFDIANNTLGDLQMYTILKTIKTKFFESLVGRKKPLDKYIN